MFEGNIKLGGGRLHCMLFNEDGTIYAGHTCGGNSTKDWTILTKLDVNPIKPKPKPQKLLSVIDPRIVNAGSWIGCIQYIEIQEMEKLLFVFQNQAWVLNLNSGSIVQSSACQNFASVQLAIKHTDSIQGLNSTGVLSNDKKYLAKGIRQPGTENYSFYPTKHMGWLQIKEVATNQVVFEEKITEDHHFGTIAFHSADHSYIALASGRSSDLWMKKWK